MAGQFNSAPAFWAVEVEAPAAGGLATLIEFRLIPLRCIAWRFHPVEAINGKEENFLGLLTVNRGPFQFVSWENNSGN